MARTAGSWGVLACLAGIAGLQTWGCDDPGDPTDPTPPDVRAVLEGLPRSVILPHLADFRERVADLQTATRAWSTSGAPADRDQAKIAWSEAMKAWQEIEAMQVGPTASSLTATGGADFRDEIYSWPVVNPCRVDQETVEAQWDSPTFFTDNLVNTYGLDALEYLLWADPGNACPGQIPLNAEGTWAELGPEGVAANRAAFAVALADGVSMHTDGLIAAWEAFALDAETFGSDQEALNAVFDALFYLESGVQDLKLGEPLGLRDCTSECLDLVESRGLSAGSNVWVVHNLIGVRELFTGGGEGGLDVVLIGAGHEDLSRRFLESLDAAQTALEALPGPIDEAAVQAPSSVDSALARVREAADVMRLEISVALALRIPAEAAGDAD